MAALDKVFRMLLAKDGSDLHVATGEIPRMRLHGRLVPIEGTPELSAEQVRDILMEIVSKELWDEYERTSDIDFAYGLEDIARFRANYFKDHSGMAAVFRLIPSEIPPFKDLGMPDAVERFAHFTDGLVLVTGPTGSGKSTTIAAILDRINSTYARHIITIEDPIEFVHTPKKSIITQRQIGTHTESFADALRAAIRLDPDVILVGEMRDLETIHLAITAAEMGTLVLGTLHTNNAIKTIDRIIDAFPADQQDQTRTMLSESLAGVVSQILMRRLDGKGRVPVVEVLIRTSALANIIREGNIPMLLSVIQAGKKQGMQSMDDGLMSLAQARTISLEEAFRRASDKAPFQKLLEEAESRKQ
ncbi:MAG: type IV pilus twitching motility protein PilT [Deltaproteobacteria bacterium]|nr:type IV pilus twitching motility protein PilT [Deltaproteobacteria bacterium]